MTAGRIAAPTAGMQRLGKTKTTAKKSPEDVAPGWYLAATIPLEQRTAALRLLERRNAADLADMLGLAVTA